ncbi:deoxycytidylate deaminase [Gottschalkia purinilytica]|uniref:Deoxycytidylate deaminase n=1 Tax=Gottschalkia purinilytica TaxID=1503 RepID=A0A0L0WE76_GOTPU|nr:cytidine/deoxycytidylate deaminase family protein [Gottschalkia purinilytica]KNF09725.1 deoxycytidylate deaminase [Gottschalkia purinilytica]
MRPTWDEYFMEIVHVVKKRSTCLRRQVGAVIVKENRILSTGYNGAPTGIRHSSETGCLRDKLKVPSGQRHELCRGLHAEQNAIVHAAKCGVNIDGSTIYVTTQPCIVCTKMIINAGITKVIYEEDYPDEMAKEFLEEAGIQLVKFNWKK